MKKKKLIAITLLILMLALSLLSLSACGEDYVYEVEMDFNYDLDDSGAFSHVVLTDKSYSYSEEIGVYPFAELGIRAQFTINKYNSKGELVGEEQYFDINRIHDFSRTDTEETYAKYPYLKSVTLIKNNGESEEAEFLVSEFRYEEQIKSGERYLAGNIGTYSIVYVMPKTEHFGNETVFTINLTVKEDSNSDIGKIVAKESCDEVKYTIISSANDGADIYLMEKGKCPNFEVRNKIDNEILDSRHLVVRSRSCLFSEYHGGKNGKVNYCRVIYKGTECKRLIYYCYIIYC